MKSDLRKKFQMADFLSHRCAREESDLREIYYRGWTFFSRGHCTAAW